MMMRQHQQQITTTATAMPSEPRSALTNGSRPSSNRLHTATSSSELLSKSLGDMPNLANELIRCSSSVSGIKHRGYLLKRSNHPYRVSDADTKLDRCLFPVDGTDWTLQEMSMSSSSQVLHPKPHAWGMEDGQSSSWNQFEPSYQDPSDFGMVPHKPQHVINEEQEASLLLMPQLPTFGTFPPPALWQNVSDLKSSAKNPFNMLAAFFGMPSVDHDIEITDELLQEQLRQLQPPIVDAINEFGYHQTLNTRLQALIAPSSTAPPIKRSSPISFGRASAATNHEENDINERSDSPDYVCHNRRMSAPTSSSSSSELPPSDIIDSSDGHLWRSKYCVLEDGVLYFYRNKCEGESPEARSERNCSMSLFEDGYDLSKSPMTRPSLLTTTSPDNNHSSNRQYLWEKRVALENVGAVRSAELEFGPNSFELLANLDNGNDNDDDDDDDDEEDGRNSNKLILRAANQKEMQEWLFQFHRSVATYFMKLVEGISMQNTFMDLHHPSCQPMAVPVSPSLNDSPAMHPGSMLLSAFSPRLRKSMVPSSTLSTSLSHGHGRVAMRRRRVADPSKADEETLKPIERNYRDVSPGESTPDRESTPLLPFSMTPSEEVSLVPDKVIHPSQLPALPSAVESSLEILVTLSDCPKNDRPRPLAGKYVPPHLRNQQQNGNGDGGGNKYVPPSVRRRMQQQASERANDSKVLSLQERAALAPNPQQAEDSTSEATKEYTSFTELSSATSAFLRVPLKLGGCADPLVAVGSILDSMYTSKKASKVGKVYTEPFGCLSGDTAASSDSNKANTNLLQWEIGAVSECGVRESNEDSYVIAADLHLMFESPPNDSDAANSSTAEAYCDTSCRNSVFAVFDGHCGNQAARFAAEKLPAFIRDQYTVDGVFVGSFGGPSKIEEALRNAILKLDQDFCNLCGEAGRDWESGTTALVAMLANEHLVIASLGDCRGIVCRCVDDSSSAAISHLKQNGWNELNVHDEGNGFDNEEEASKWMRANGSESDEDVGKKPTSKLSLWRQLSDIHSPAREDERARIEESNGWITTETELPIGQMQRMDFCDADVFEIVKRCLVDPSQHPKASAQRILTIARVCGELAVSRAIGDKDFKAAYNKKSACTNHGWYNNSLELSYPDEHNHNFVGDLVSGIPEFDSHRVGEPGISDEFLLIACDGLWDVMDPDDAVQITRRLLFTRKLSAKRAAARLAEIAIHLGSNDNITVIVVRFFRSE